MKVRSFAAVLILYALSSFGFADVGGELGRVFHLDTISKKIECPQNLLNSNLISEFNGPYDEVTCYQRNSELYYARNLVNKAVEDGMAKDYSDTGGTYTYNTLEEVDGVLTQFLNRSTEIVETNLTLQLHEINKKTIIFIMYTDSTHNCPAIKESGSEYSEFFYSFVCP